jgi:hypothetical protein
MGPQRLHGNFGGCGTGRKTLGRWPIFKCTKARFDRGIALASAESTAATLPNYAWTIVFQVWKQCKQTRLGGLAKAFGLFYVDAFGAEN